MGDVVDWLGEACSSLEKKGRTHLLRSPGRPLLLSPLENLAQILITKKNTKLVPQKGGQREGHRPRHNQSEHQPIKQQTCTLNMAPRLKAKKKKSKKTICIDDGINPKTTRYDDYTYVSDYTFNILQVKVQVGRGVHSSNFVAQR